MTTYSIYATNGGWLVDNVEGTFHEDALATYAAKDEVSRCVVRPGEQYIVIREGSLGLRSAKLLRLERVETPTFRAVQA